MEVVLHVKMLVEGRAIVVIGKGFTLTVNVWVVAQTPAAGVNV
jgi:hypothetical protein